MGEEMNKAMRSMLKLLLTNKYLILGVAAIDTVIVLLLRLAGGFAYLIAGSILRVIFIVLSIYILSVMMAFLVLAMMGWKVD